MAAPAVKFQVNVASDAQWREEIHGVEGQVQVVEVYQAWAGPVKCIVSTLSSIYFDLGDVPLKFYTACADHIDELAEFRGHCQPVFLFFRDGKQFHRIDGVIASQIRNEVDRIAAEYGSNTSAMSRKPVFEHQKSLPAAAM